MTKCAFFSTVYIVQTNLVTRQQLTTLLAHSRLQQQTVI